MNRMFRDPKAFSTDPIVREWQEASIIAADLLQAFSDIETPGRHDLDAARLRCAVKAFSDRERGR